MKGIVLINATYFVKEGNSILGPVHFGPIEHYQAKYNILDMLFRDKQEDYMVEVQENGDVYLDVGQVVCFTLDGLSLNLKE